MLSTSRISKINSTFCFHPRDNRHYLKSDIFTSYFTFITRNTLRRQICVMKSDYRRSKFPQFKLEVKVARILQGNFESLLNDNLILLRTSWIPYIRCQKFSKENFPGKNLNFLFPTENLIILPQMLSDSSAAFHFPLMENWDKNSTFRVSSSIQVRALTKWSFH